MIANLVVVIINMLIIMAMNATLSLKTTQYKDNITIDTVETLINQEKIMTEAIDSYCRNNIDICFTNLKTNNIKNMQVEELIDFIPNGINLEKMNDLFYQNIAIDYQNKQIILTHEINNLLTREKYFTNYKNKNQETICINNETKPCVSNIVYKNVLISEDLKIKFLEKEIVLLENKLLVAETYVGEHALYTDQINLYKTDIDNLKITKQNRKLSNFKGE